MNGKMSKTSYSQIKKQNKQLIYDLIYNNSGLTRKEITKQLDLSLPTVTEKLQELLSDGLIAADGYVRDTGGRNAQTYTALDRARTAIGIDITRNHITCAAVDMKGNIIDTIRIRQQFEQTDFYSGKVSAMIDQLISQANLDRETILGVGIGLPGLVTSDNRSVFYGKILDCEGLDVSFFSRNIPFPCRLFNDAKAAGFAEMWTNRSIVNAFYFMLSNNIGGAVIMDNSIYSGKNICASEVGHIKIGGNQARCYCGQKGCFDTCCAASVLSDEYDHELSAFFVDLKAHSEKAVKKWDEYLENLALAINTVRLLFDCTIILGGYVGGFLEPYLNDLRSRVVKYDTFRTPLEDITICRFKNQSIAAGAALNFVSDYISSI